MKKKWIIVIIVVLLAVAAIGVIKRKQKEIANLPKPEVQVATVKTAIAVKGDLEIVSHQLAEIKPFTSADLAPRITGHILSIAVREGDLVQEGDVVCVIDDREFADRTSAIQSETSAARQRLTGAQSVYETQRLVTERDEKLFKSGAISKEALERSQSALDSARAAVEAYQETIKGLEKNVGAATLQSDYTRVKAPFSGVITKRLAEPGDLAVPGKPVLTMEQPSPVKVVAQIPQELVKKLKPEATVYITDGTDRMKAEITRVYPDLAKNFMGSVEIVLDRAPFGLSTGSTAGIDIVTADVKGILVPENAIVRTGKGFFIYLVENKDTIRVRQVEFLGSDHGMAAIKGDLPEGSVVAVGQENRLLTLMDGMKVDTGGKP